MVISLYRLHKWLYLYYHLIFSVNVDDGDDGRYLYAFGFLFKKQVKLVINTINGRFWSKYV
jgi:hypothetical protein